MEDVWSYMLTYEIIASLINREAWVMWFLRPEQEDAYARWVESHPEGFVLNHPRGSRFTGNIVHRANCDAVQRAIRDTAGGRLIRDYVKFCTPHLDDVEPALQALTPGAEFRPCRRCNPSDTGFRNWWLNHSQSHKWELEGGYIWSPQVGPGDVQRQGWLNVGEVLPGDRVFSYAKGMLRAVGIAKSKPYNEPPPSVGHSSWSGAGWKVDVDWRPLKEPFSATTLIELVRPYLPKRNSPLKPNGHANLIYLSEISSQFAEIIVSMADHRDIGLADDLDRRQIIESEPDITVREALYLARVGQGRFRDRVADVEQACRLTKVSDRSYLVASHIKPWRACSNFERLDGHNGLLLAPHVDRLFDRGAISFADNGDLLIRDSSVVEVMESWGLPTATVNVGSFSTQQKAYLHHHRKHIFGAEDVADSP